MLIKTIGITNMEKFDKHLISIGKKAILINELEAVKRQRNDAAHTWIIGRTQTYPAPSQILGRLQNIYPIMREMYSEAIRINSRI